MPTSRLHATITELVTILGADAALSEVEVIDGPPTTDQSRHAYVSIGWQPDGESSGDFVQSFNAAGARTRDEDWAVLGYLYVWSGDNDIATLRGQLFELLAVIENALRATNAAPTKPTLNGIVLWAQITNGQLHQANTSEGARVGLAFTIRGHARL